MTAIELMPVHQFVQDSTLLDQGLRNYWGYNTLGFLAPHADYAAAGQLGQQVQEFKSMVRAMHAAGIEVILDVVYNHTAEGNHLGPTLSFKGLDNPAYYRLVEDDLRYYMDYTGTGNSLNVRHPHSLQLIMDSLRYWVIEMHVDGFRFDLASALAREFYDVDRLSTFFELVQQDPVVSQVKLIAEPWDVGPGGYQVGGFPPQWTEWNGKFRDTVRDFWRGEPSLGEFASRLSGSSDLYEQSGRRPVASINFVTAHDGFTLRDLVSYNDKHNEANGEDNNDGESHNRSWNHGVEGPTDDPEILALRAKQQRNFITTLLLSQGVPMLLHGDEVGRTQQGNNNTYAQDGPISWVHWDEVDEPLVEFTRARGPAAPRAHDVPTSPLLHRYDGAHRQRRGRAPQRHRLAAPRRPADGGRRLERPGGEVDRDVPQRPRHPEPRQSRPARRGRPLPAVLQRRRGRRTAHASARGVRRGLGRRHRHRQRYAGARPRCEPASARRSPDAACSCSASTARRRPLPSPRPPRRSPPRSRARRRTGKGRYDLTMRVPTSTYRLQVNARFTLHDAAATLPYLHDLGVDWVYLSPLLKAEPGSDHGYDVVDHAVIDPERGGREGLAAVSAEAKRLGMGVLVDIVPNHMGVATPRENTWWWDLLLRGRDSAHADAFDVDWEAGGGRVRIPVLGDDGLAAVEVDARDGDRALPRPRLPPRTRDDRRWRSSTTSSCTGRRPITASTTGASSPSTPWPACGSRTAACSRTRTSRSAAGSTRGSSTDCASTTPTACATPRRTSTT